MVRKVHEEATSLGGRTYQACGPLLDFSDSVFLPYYLSYTGKKTLYILSDVLTTVSQVSPLFLFRAVFLTDLDRHGASKSVQGQVL
jgi:hypothetical protein